jgi:hypothetical protein
MGEPDDRDPRRQGARRLTPLAVWAITALWGSLLLGASVLWPMGYGYDEMTHADMAYHYSAQPFRFFGPGQAGYTTGIVNAQKLRAQAPHVRLAVEPVPARDRRPTLAQLGGPAWTGGGIPDQMIQHPPLYYEMEGLVMRLAGHLGTSWDQEIWLMRLFGVLLVLPVPWLCWDTTRRFLEAGQRRAERGSRFRAGVDPGRVALLGAVLPLSLPNLVRDASSVSNDGLLVVTTSAFVWAAVRVSAGDLSMRAAAWMSASLALALWTKGFALVLPVIVPVAYLLGWRADRRRRAEESTEGAVPADGGTDTVAAAVTADGEVTDLSAGPAGDTPSGEYPVVVPARSGPAHVRRSGPRWKPQREVLAPFGLVVAGALVGSIWWIRNLVEFHTVQINGFGKAIQTKLYGTPTYDGKLSKFVAPFLRGMLPRIWGGIGEPDIPTPGKLVEYGWPWLVAAGIVVALVAGSGRSGRLRAAMLLLVALLTLGVVAEGSFSTFHEWSNSVRANQGRYLYSSVAAVAAVAAAGWSRLAPRRAGVWLATALLVLATATNAYSWVVILRSWYQPLTGRGGLRGFTDALHGLVRWSPLPYGFTVAFVLVLPALTGLLALAATARDAIRS